MRYLFLLALFLFGFDAAAQPGNHTRKPPRQPGFFMPEGALKYRTGFPQPVARRPASGGAAIISREPVPEAAPATHAAANKTNRPAPDNAGQKPPASPYMNLDFSRMTQTPEYQQKYSDYMADLEVIAKSGVAPFSRQVQNDLAQMNSDERRPVR